MRAQRDYLGQLNAPQHAGRKFDAVGAFRRVCVVWPAHFSQQFSGANLQRILRFGRFSREDLFDELVKDKPALAPALDGGSFDIGRLVGNGIRASEYGELGNRMIDALLMSAGLPPRDRSLVCDYGPCLCSPGFEILGVRGRDRGMYSRFFASASLWRR